MSEVYQPQMRDDEGVVGYWWAGSKSLTFDKQSRIILSNHAYEL